MNFDYELIRAAIIRRAVIDYKAALRYKDYAKIAKLEKFFLSGWGELLSYGHGEYIIEHTKEMVRNEK